ncbi:MAG: aspartate aminotransferase family protein [Bacteroidota bacterium]
MLNNRAIFLNHQAQTSQFPVMLEIDRGEGVHLYDPKGKAYIDLISGISVSSLGHCHPKVVEAVQHQAGQLMHAMVYGEYVLSPQAQLAQKLTEQLPDQLDCVYLVNSGTEATEGAMKLAKRFTGRHEIISCFNAYHGSTQGAMSLNSDAYYTQSYLPLLPGIKHIKFNCFKGLERKISKQTAAVIVETVQAESGVCLPADGYLKKLRQRCDETGTLLIFDEIQVGMGRTGSLFAFEQYDVVPDILLLAKALGGGMPIGAFVANHQTMQVFTDHPSLGHITTFGGHPVPCAAALANLEVLVESDFIQQVPAKAALIRSLLEHPAILDIRNAGFLMAVELESFELVQDVIHRAMTKGVIVDWFLFNSKCIRIAPPLIITEEEIKTACVALLEAIDEAYRNLL